MKKNNTALFASTGLRAIMGPMTAAERATGRYLRAPDGHDGGVSGGGGTPTPSPTPSPAPSITIQPSVTDINTVPEALRPFYFQKDANSPWTLDDPNSLRGHLANLKNENQSLKGKNSQFSKLVEAGIDADTALRLHNEAQNRETERLTQEGDFKTLKEQMETNFNNERQNWTGREQKLVGTIDKILVQDAARAALSDPDIDGNPTLLLPLIRDRVKVTETDDGFSVQVLRPDGAPMLNAQNQPASLKDLFLEMKGKPEYAGAFKGLNQSGGGAPSQGSGHGGGAPGAQKGKSQMTLAEKTKFIQQHGLPEYNKLPDKV